MPLRWGNLSVDGSSWCLLGRERGMNGENPFIGSDERSYPSDFEKRTSWFVEVP